MSEKQTSDRFGVAGRITTSGKPVIVVDDYVSQQRLALSLEDASGLAGHLGLAVRATLQALVQESKKHQAKPENRIVLPGRN